MNLNIPYYDKVLSEVALGQFHRMLLKLDKRDKVEEYDIIYIPEQVIHVYPSYMCGLLGKSLETFNNKYNLFHKYGFDHAELSVITDMYKGLTRAEHYR